LKGSTSILNFHTIDNLSNAIVKIGQGILKESRIFLGSFTLLSITLLTQ